LLIEERTAIKVKSWKINRDTVPQPVIPKQATLSAVSISNPLRYEQWLATNVFEQKQKVFTAYILKYPLAISQQILHANWLLLSQPYVADEIRITQNQGLLLKFVRKEALPALYEGLHALDLAAPGFDSLADVTTCPGTDTCNLGISNSMTMAKVLEDVIYNEYEDFIYNREIKIKISGCMNSCGQHGLAHIGFHGSSLKAGTKVLPSVQVMLGGGTVGNGEGRAAERVIKVPSKRATACFKGCT
jgi:sulfite reductase (ferredoxin)